uniref:Secreted protein n=1 Tax=Parastrongyloides trichosuri TaxID=131310 RepID=A0A0N4ZVV9_PARTI
MIKAFLFIISILVAFREIHVAGHFCDGEDFTVEYKGRFTCYGEPHGKAIMMVGQCKDGTNFCKMDRNTVQNDNDVIEGTSGKLEDSDDELYLIVTPFCGTCSKSFKLPISESGVNCGPSSGNVHDFGNVELSEHCHN